MSNTNADISPGAAADSRVEDADLCGRIPPILGSESDLATDRSDPGRSLRTPPKELGVMLVSAGVVGFILPGPGVPALLAGGMILWPEGFGKVEGWFRRRFPSIHRKGMGQIGRFLSDLERRYPGSTGPCMGTEVRSAPGEWAEPEQGPRLR